VDHDDVNPVRPDYAEVFMPPVDLSFSCRYAYALIEPASASPGFLLRRAIELHGDNPVFAMAASYYGAMMIVFRSEEDREATIRRAPFTYLGHEIKLERPEDGENRFAWAYTSYAQVSAMGFPLEHWNEGGIRTAFRSVGSVCCIDPLCLNELDFLAVRLVLRLEHAMDVPRTLLLCDFDGELTTEV
jgi:hypothetical protein